MDELLKKMNFKAGMRIGLVAVPDEMKDWVESWKQRDLVANDMAEADFFLAFVQSEKDIETSFQTIQPFIRKDQVFWMAYPKGSSKKYQVRINRDKGWQVLGDHGFEGVRQVSLDGDWSALRFRHIDFIKILTRKNRMT
ncbi:hypothetical protein [Pararhodonellum marinum]|uniref:hypothetical protein n=1 Tax=Pararhodonellum marinum TaxID=2755358 RepID=UPI00188EF3B3|nr:hypothetical protein [Pararhodonellum marinum]